MPFFFKDLEELKGQVDKNVIYMCAISGGKFIYIKKWFFLLFLSLYLKRILYFNFLFLAVLDIILLVLFIISTLKCISNFGKGLKKLIFKNKLKNNEISEDSPDLKNISTEQSIEI
jgi:hypothetical protein